MENIINSVQTADRGLGGRTDMQEIEKILEEIDREVEEYMEIDFGDEYNAGIKDMAKMSKKIIEKHMNDAWIPVEDRLPDESLNSVIGWDEYRERCCFVQYYAGKWALRVDREPIKITHWRPLPGRPGRSKGE